MFTWTYEQLFSFAVWLGKVAFKRLVGDVSKRRDILKRANELLEEAKRYVAELEKEPLR